jgi:RNA polymerase sigma-70 factor (ECF subfamily)
VISWYDALPGLAGSPVARLNRAAAVAGGTAPGAVPALVDAIDSLSGYPWWQATRAELLQRLGRPHGPAAPAVTRSRAPIRDPSPAAE